MAVGHGNPRVGAAVAAQMHDLVHVSNLYFTEPMVSLAERLTALSGLDRVFFCNDGATANEAAIKLARRYGQTTRGSECYLGYGSVWIFSRRGRGSGSMDAASVRVFIETAAASPAI